MKASTAGRIHQISDDMPRRYIPLQEGTTRPDQLSYTRYAVQMEADAAYHAHKLRQRNIFNWSRIPSSIQFFFGWSQRPVRLSTTVISVDYSIRPLTLFNTYLSCIRWIPLTLLTILTLGWSISLIIEAIISSAIWAECRVELRSVLYSVIQGSV